MVRRQHARQRGKSTQVKEHHARLAQPSLSRLNPLVGAVDVLGHVTGKKPLQVVRGLALGQRTYHRMAGVSNGEKQYHAHQQHGDNLVDLGPPENQRLLHVGYVIVRHHRAAHIENGGISDQR